MFAAARPRNIDLRPTTRTDIALRGWAGRTRPSAAYSRRSSSRRTVSGGALSPSGRQLSRNLKYIVGIRIPEFESYVPSQAVGLHAPVLFWDLPPHQPGRLCGQNSGWIPGISATFQRDILRRRF
jgi:hypothetical protein